MYWFKIELPIFAPLSSLL